MYTLSAGVLLSFRVYRKFGYETWSQRKSKMYPQIMITSNYMYIVYMFCSIQPRRNILFSY